MNLAIALLRAYTIPKERACFEKTCGRTFEPTSLTKFFCSEECAWLSRARREGTLTPARESEILAAKTARLEAQRAALRKARKAKARKRASVGRTDQGSKHGNQKKNPLAEGVSGGTGRANARRVHRKHYGQLHAGRSNKRKRR